MNTDRERLISKLKEPLGEALCSILWQELDEWLKALIEECTLRVSFGMENVVLEVMDETNGAYCKDFNLLECLKQSCDWNDPDITEFIDGSKDFPLIRLAKNLRYIASLCEERHQVITAKKS